MEIILIIITIFIHNIELWLCNDSYCGHTTAVPPHRKVQWLIVVIIIFFTAAATVFPRPSGTVVCTGGATAQSAHDLCRRHPLCRGGSSNLVTSLTQHNIYVYALCYYYNYRRLLHNIHPLDRQTNTASPLHPTLIYCGCFLIIFILYCSVYLPRVSFFCQLIIICLPSPSISVGRKY